MACACKVDAQMTYLQKKYGNNIPTSKKSDIRGSVKKLLKKILGWCLVIMFLPIALVSILVRHTKPIKIDKVFKIKNERYKQVI